MYYYFPNNTLIQNQGFKIEKSHALHYQEILKSVHNTVECPRGLTRLESFTLRMPYGGPW